MNIVRGNPAPLGPFAPIDLRIRYTERYLDLDIVHPEGMHCHDGYEIYLNISGDVSFVVENAVYHVQAGDMIVTKANEFHYCLYHKSGQYRHFCIWFQSADPALFADLEKRPNGTDNLVRLDDEEQSRCIADFAALLNAEKENPRTRCLYLLRIIDRIAHFKSKQSLSVQIPENVQTIFDYIDDHFASIVSLDAVYKHFFISPCTLYRYYKQYLQITPAKYIEAKRLAHAKRLLSEGKSAMAACLDSGFPDYAHFIRLFRNTFGITPGKYAKQTAALKAEKEEKSSWNTN